MKFVIVLNLFIFLALVSTPKIAHKFMKNYDLKISKVRKQNKKRSNNHVVKVTEAVKKINFTPRIHQNIIKYSDKDIKNKKITFLEIQKNSPVYKKSLPIVHNVVDRAAKQIVKRKVEHRVLSLSYNELNDQGRVTIRKINKISWKNFKLKLRIEPIISNNIELIAENIKNNLDRISTKASATERSIVNNKKISLIRDESFKVKNEKHFDELVYFDYEGEKVTATEKEFTLNEESSINVGTSNVINTDINNKEKTSLMAIQKEIISKVNATKIEKPASNTVFRRPLRTNYPVVAAVTNSKPPEQNNAKSFLDEGNASASLASQSTDENDHACINQNKIKRNTYKSEYRIKLDSINHLSTQFENIHNFEVRFSDDFDDIEQDFGSGEILLNLNTVGVMNIRRGVILASNHYPTTVDFVFEGLSTQINVPVFTRESFENLVASLKLKGLGGHFLIELDDRTEDIDLDVKTNYEGKIYLNDDFKFVNRSDSNYKYILFIGVDPGNSIVYFKTSKNEVTHKIIHFVEKEIYYEPNFYAEVLDDSFETYGENLTGRCKAMLPISESRIDPWSFDEIIRKTSVNQYVLQRMVYPVGTRKYYEFKHLDENIYVGRWGENEVILPSEDYISHILSSFDVGENECMIQVNLVKKIERISLNGSSERGIMQPRMKLLDEDGLFYSEVSDKSTRVFIQGEEQGIINIKLEYVDGSKQYIQTFCSESTYLVEQL